MKRCQKNSTYIDFNLVSVTCLCHVRVFLQSGYKLHVDYFRNCGKNDVVQLSDDFQPTLNDDCSVTLWGCTTVKHAFKSAQVKHSSLLQSFVLIRHWVGRSHIDY